MKKALIAGAGGFVGSHLAEHLLSKKISTFGFVHPNHPSVNLKGIKEKITVVKCDILDKKSILEILKKNKFDYVFHLAAFSSPAESFQNPKETLENNIIGQLNLLESLVKTKSPAKILIVGSADEYKDISEKDLPVDESTPLEPLTPYAVSKVAQDLLGYQFYLHHKLNIIRVRPFNHIGPRQSPSFVVSAFASRIAGIEKKNGGKIKVGNLDTYRDFTDVRDMAKAYLLALEKCRLGEVYNIGSGKAYKIADILNKLISKSTVKIEVIKDKRLFHSKEILKIYCDYSKFHKATDWKPQIPIDKTLSDTIDYERQRISQNSKAQG